MIVKLCQTDLLKLVNDEAIVIDNLTVRTTTEDKSSYYHESYASSEAYRQEVGATRTAEISKRRSNARQKIVGSSANKQRSGQRWMNARFKGTCYFPGCRTALVPGDLMLRDDDGGRNLCEGHGASEYPNLPKPAEEVNA